MALSGSESDSRLREPLPFEHSHEGSDQKVSERRKQMLESSWIGMWSKLTEHMAGSSLFQCSLRFPLKRKRRATQRGPDGPLFHSQSTVPIKIQWIRGVIDFWVSVSQESDSLPVIVVIPSFWAWTIDKQGEGRFESTRRQLRRLRLICSSG